jgi:sensor domain CHASE-containing protein
LYDKCKKAANFGVDDLNIEGSFFVNNKWYLWQRGNGENGRNGVFVYDKLNKHIDFHTIELPIINNFQTTFTDCILVDGKIYFLAAAENSSSTVDDGLIYGSLIGCMDLDSFAIIAFEKISDTQKFEGLTLFENTDLSYSFLLCEDNDVLSSGSNIYKITIDKN